MTKKNKTQDPYKMELLDLWNEVGGTMKIEFGGTTISLTQEQIQLMKDNGARTDVMSCILTGLAYSGKTMGEAISFIEDGFAAGAAPSVTFEAAEGEALNITGKENNPMVNQLVEAIENQ